jgi:hypothetical protein
VYEVGDIITCVADANPTATYYWQNVRTQQYYNSANYVITEDMRGMNDQLRCHAQNIIQGYIYAANYFINAFVVRASAFYLSDLNVYFLNHELQFVIYCFCP